MSPPRALGAPTALNRVPVVKPVDDGTYRRDRFGDGWADLDHDGCRTREEIMARDLTNVTRVRGCNVVKGTLHDPYTGRTIEYREADSQAVQIDHRVPLSLAWRLGAKSWTTAERVRFANDPRNLVAVDGPTNSRKSDKGPSAWLPPDPGARCGYARRFTAVLYAYRKYPLGVSAADKAALTRVLDGCRGHRIYRRR